MAETMAELRSISDEELIKRHDDRAGQTNTGTAHYIAELSRRDQQRVSDAMLDCTRHIKTLTIWIAILTLISTAFVIWSVVK